MNRSNVSLLHSNRTASRRLHRRSALPALSHPCVAIPRSPLENAPQTLVGLSRGIVKDAGMLELLAAELRIAELEKSLEEARSFALVDSLTGALNRRGFEKAYESEMARARRSGSRLALVMIDLDDFKVLNDRYGHLAGDKALIHLVSILQGSMRPSDVLCRFGGEEFVLLLPDAAIDHACKAVRRFLSEFSSRVVPGVNQAMTFSAGVVSHDYFESLEEVIERADVATYAAKRAGKNRVMPG